MSARDRVRLGDRLLGFFGVRLAIFVIAAQAFLPGVLLDPAYKVAYYHDEHHDIVHEEAARMAVVDDHQLPAYNPYFCGGIVELSNAPSNVLAPDFLLRIVYGTLVGRRLTVLLFVLLGMEGCFRYARKNGASAIGGAMAGVAFATSGHFVSLLGWGWVFMFNYNLVPWVMLSFENGLRKKWWIIAGGFFLAWLVLGGGTYVVPYTGLVLLLLVLYETARAVFRRNERVTCIRGDEIVPWYRPALTLAGMGIVALGLSAIRVFPLIHLLLTHSRPVMQKDATKPLSLLAMLALPKEHASSIAGAGDFYVGLYVCVLAVVALVFLDKRAIKLWAFALFFAVLACGEFIEHSPYALMRKLPLFSQLRFPDRMATLSALFLALAASFAITKIEDALPRFSDWCWPRLRRCKRFARRITLPEEPWLPLRVVVTLAAFGVAAYVAKISAADVVAHNAIGRGSLYVMDAPQRVTEPFQQSRGNRWDAHVWPFVNKGSLHCFEEHQLFESPNLRGDLEHEEYGAPGADTTVERIRWSPHEIVLKVHSNGPGRFLVNQNHSDAWKTDTGELGSDGGLISVQVPAGDHVVTLTYSDWRVRLGALVTFATVLAIAIAGGKRLRKKGIAFVRWFRVLP
ncbi:MAG: hypothetical protein FWD69_18745 [Polyangiaceae bacterium]|nr:hypothetical protein [Polyangiaceae bacterium]